MAKEKSDILSAILDRETFNRNIYAFSFGETDIFSSLKVRGFDSTIFHMHGAGAIDTFCLFGKCDGDILANPPCPKAEFFVRKALSMIPEGHKAALLLKLTWSENTKRDVFFVDCPPSAVYAFRKSKKRTDTVDGAAFTMFAWFVWKKGFKGVSTINYI